MNDPLKHLEDFRLGQESGLRYFIGKFGHALRFFAYSIIRDKEAAEEIVSDSFYKLWKGREKVKSFDNIKAFLYISTRNACYDYTDTLKNRVYAEEDALETMICQDVDVLTQIIYAELVQLIVKEVNKLPQQQAAVFRMTCLEGLSTQEVSEKLGTTTSNVYFAKSKAISTLRRAFEHSGFRFFFIFILLINLLTI